MSPTFEAGGSMFVDACRDREKVSWRDDASMIKQIMSFTPPWPGAVRLGAQPVNAVTEQDLEAFIRHVGSLRRATATRNHYVRVLRAMDRWLVRKGHRGTPILSGESDVIRKRKQRSAVGVLAPTKKGGCSARRGRRTCSV